MSVKEKVFTYEDIDRIPEGCEVIKGRLRELAPTTAVQGYYKAEIAWWIDEQKEAEGYVLVGEVGLVISRNPLTVRCADIVFLSKEKVKELPKGLIEVPPDLVVEIVSPSNTYEEIEEKIADYMGFGVGRILIVEPAIRKVTLINEERKIAILGFDQEVEILPGIRLKMAELGGGE